MILGALAALAVPAAAQPSLTPTTWEAAPEPPPVLRRLHVALGGGLRFTNLDVHDEASKMQLLEYGWASARSPVMPQFAAELEYLLAPIIDIGVAVSTAHSDHAAGIDWNDRVETRTTSIALVAKVHWALQRPFIPEPRVDLGVARRTITVHGTEDTDAVPFVRAGMDWRLGTRRAGAQVSAGYVVTARASSGRLDPAVGGLDVTLSPFVRF
ncbi:MAG: hypothetical protein K8M05_31475 [Deltaproteobacteria bacterium]|nr:hypothetical protein [Kofleriaceae bacterium]